MPGASNPFDVVTLPMLGAMTGLRWRDLARDAAPRATLLAPLPRFAPALAHSTAIAFPNGSTIC